MSALDAVRKLPLFDGLDAGQLDALERILQRRVVPPRTTMFSEGDRSTSLYILARGSVGTTKRLGLAVRGPLDEKKQKTLVRFVAPQFFGEMGLLSDLERSATITTETECEILELARADFERLAARDPALGLRLVRNVAMVLADRLRRTDLDVLKLTAALSLALGNR